MKRFLLLTALAGLLAPAAGRAADAFYINNGIVSTFFPPTAAPDIDALNFVNNGLFEVTNLFFESPTFIPDPFETSDTLNYTNHNLMLGDPGWRFETFSTSDSLWH